MNRCAEIAHACYMIRAVSDQCKIDNCVTFRYCLLEARKHKQIHHTHSAVVVADATAAASHQQTVTWQSVCRRLLAVCLHSLTCAMKIVAEANSDVPLNEATAAGGGAVPPTINTKGPVQSHANVHIQAAGVGAGSSKSSGSKHLAATYMNTNSNMGHVQTNSSGPKSAAVTDGHHADNDNEVATNKKGEDGDDDFDGSNRGPVSDRVYDETQCGYCYVILGLFHHICFVLMGLCLCTCSCSNVQWCRRG